MMHQAVWFIMMSGVAWTVLALMVERGGYGDVWRRPC